MPSNRLKLDIISGRLAGVVALPESEAACRGQSVDIRIAIASPARLSRKRQYTMRVLVAGATGLSWFLELVPFLTKQGHDVYRLTRSKPQEAYDIAWDPLEISCRRDASTVARSAWCHLAGENIAGKRWTPKVKEELRRSRIEGTKLLLRNAGTTRSIAENADLRFGR